MVRVPTHREPTHPGEMLSGPLSEGERANQPSAWDHAGYRLEACEVLWKLAGLLDEPSASVGPLSNAGGRSRGAQEDPSRSCCRVSNKPAVLDLLTRG